MNAEMESKSALTLHIRSGEPYYCKQIFQLHLGRTGCSGTKPDLMQKPAQRMSKKVNFICNACTSPTTVAQASGGSSWRNWLPPIG